MIRQKQLLIKADDYGQYGSNLDPWRRFIDVLLNANLTFSIGVIALPLSRGPRSVMHYLRAMVEHYGIEVWNHSLSHRNLTSLDPQDLIHDVSESQRIIFSETGIRPKIFGAPFNKIDAPSARVIVDTKEFSGFYFFDGLIQDEMNIDGTSLRILEMGTMISFPIQEKVLLEHLATKKNNDFVTLQVHPQYWSNACIGNFASVVHSLTNRGYQSITAADRLDYLSYNNNPVQPHLAERSIGSNIALEERVLNSTSVEKEGAPFSRADSAYYLRVLRRGTSEIVQFLRTIGFFNLPTPHIGKQVRILDVGCGVGNWSCAATVIPDGQVIALDREDFHVRHLAVAENVENLIVKIEDVASVHFEPRSLSAIICNNTISYLELVQTLERFQCWLVNSGRVFVGIQNRLYPLRDAVEAASKGDWPKAKSFLLRLVSNEGARYGLERAFVRYYSGDELSSAAKAAGLLIQRRNISPPGNYNDLLGLDVFSGYLLIKTAASSNAIERNLPGAQDEQRSWPERLQALRHATTSLGRDRLVKHFSEHPSSEELLSDPALESLASATGLPSAAIPRASERHESLIFYSKATTMLLGQHFDSKYGFCDPLFGIVLDLLHIVIDGNSLALPAWEQELRKYLRHREAYELAYWL